MFISRIGSVTILQKFNFANLKFGTGTLRTVECRHCKILTLLIFAYREIKLPLKLTCFTVSILMLQKLLMIKEIKSFTSIQLNEQDDCFQ